MSHAKGKAVDSVVHVVDTKITSFVPSLDPSISVALDVLHFQHMER